MRGQQAVKFGPITVSPAGTFELRGGRYILAATATAFGTSVELQAIGPDGATLQSIPSAFVAGAATKLTAAGQIVADLPPGQYGLVLTGVFTACNVSIVRVPLE